MLVVDACSFCSIWPPRIWIKSEHAIAFAADAPVAEGHIIIVPKGHIPSIHALPMAVQKSVWALVSRVRRRLRTGFLPNDGFSIGFVDGLTAAQLVPHAVIHVIPRRVGDRVELPECDEWISDDGVLASALAGRPIAE